MNKRQRKKAWKTKQAELVLRLGFRLSRQELSRWCRIVLRHRRIVQTISGTLGVSRVVNDIKDIVYGRIGK